MRRLATGLGAAFCLLLATPEGGAHPGHGDFVKVEVGGFAFRPAEVRITAGEGVTWNWAGPDRNHSVTADPGQAESFDSDPSGPPGPTSHPDGQGFSHTFTQRGTYAYRCKVHDSMRGSVVVDPAPPPDEAPRVEALRAPARARARVTVRFALTEDAVVLAEVDRLRDDRLVLSRSVSLLAGSRSITLPLARLRPGSYRVRLVGVDAAGQAGPAAQALVRVVRPARAKKRAARRTRR